MPAATHRVNVAALFDAQAAASPDALALHWDDQTLSYGALRERARGFAAVLASRRIGQDDRVALLLPNDPAAAVALLGTLWRGATAAVLSPAWAPADAATALAVADARLLVTTGALARAVGADPAATLLVDDGAPMGALGRAIGECSAVAAQPPATRDANDPASILFSSGTTGDPKGVVLTHGNLSFNATSKRRYCGIRPDDRLALVVPAAHCFGQNVILLGALLSGAGVRIYRRFDPDAVSSDILRGRVTMLLAAPPAFTRLLDRGDDSAPRRLRYALTAAAPLGDLLPRRWREASGRPLAQGYGLTECSPFATYDGAVPDEGRRVGVAIDGVTVRIAADGDAWAREGEPGEIVIRGPNVMAGYWQRPEATSRALRGGWLRTGDIGLLDDGGQLHLVGRVDDVINVAGFKVWPSDVERAFTAHPLVAEAAAYASPDPVRGFAVSVALVLRRNAPGDVDAVREYASGRLAPFQRPTMVRVLDDLPRSPTGKILRRALAGPP